MKAQKIMARSKGFAMQNGSKLGHTKYRRMVRKRALKRRETKLENCEVTPQAVWPIAESLSKMSRPRAPSEIHGLLNPIFYPIDKANIIANCL
jgi:hypothetical protein